MDSHNINKLYTETQNLLMHETEEKFYTSSWELRDDGGKISVFLKGEVSPNNNVDWVSRKQFYKQ